ncbi:MAG: ferredoxin [Dehalococcoidia bacterium]|nr:ferredoxin [Dehalococcoidia bacterium]
MKVVVDFDRCESSGKCCELAPDYFALDRDNYLVIRVAEPGEEARALLEACVGACPTQAIRLEAS